MMQHNVARVRSLLSVLAELRRFGRGELSREIQRIAERVNIVSARSVIGELRALGVEVDQQRPESSVGNALRRLVRTGVLKEINPGSGRRPATYQLSGRQMNLW